MYLKLVRAAAILASPSVPPQDFQRQSRVQFEIQSQARVFWSDDIHELTHSPVLEMHASAQRAGT